MHRAVTAGRPTGSVREETRVIYLADEDSRTGRVRPLHLGVAAKTEIGIPDDQHFGVDGAVRLVAHPATLAQGRVLKNRGFGLFPMTGSAGLVAPRQPQTTRRLPDVLAVRIVTLGTIHFALGHRMVLRKVELGLRFQMAVKTRLRLPARVDNEFAPAATDREVAAGGAMTGFATLGAGELDSGHAQPPMGARGKAPGLGLMALPTSLVTDVIGAFDALRRRDQGGGSRTGGQKQSQQGGEQKHRPESPARWPPALAPPGPS